VYPKKTTYRLQQHYKVKKSAAVMGVLDAVADVRKNTENYTGGKCIININNFRASVLYSNIFESLGF
jgi:hypothetical protein